MRKKIFIINQKKYQINLSPKNSDSVIKQETRERMKDNASKNDQNELKIVEKSVKSFSDKVNLFGEVKSRLSKFGRRYLSISKQRSNDRNGIFRAEPAQLTNDAESNTCSSVKQSSFSCK
ncbi:hypothetical protein [Rickettsiella massiliensis]|uniref:hypothetical protein n=1 Tax=Rickettsiella massiliensis TaxID=676517 RepID=UPI00049613BB|nr:hypothetical protein [Rickettsiella massiliensis]